MSRGACYASIMIAIRRVFLTALIPLLSCGGLVGTVDGGTDAGSDANVCILSASHYAQTCNVASDCSTIFAGDACSPTVCICPNAVIAQSSRAQYDADLAATHAHNNCFCPLSPAPTCCAGTCSMQACDAGH